MSTSRVPAIAPAHRGPNALNNVVFGVSRRPRPPPPTMGRCLNGACPQADVRSGFAQRSPNAFVPRPPYSLRDWKPNQQKRCVKGGSAVHGVPPHATCDTCRPEPIVIAVAADAPPATSASVSGSLQIEWCADDGCCCVQGGRERTVRWALRQVTFNNVQPVIRTPSDHEQVVAIVDPDDPQRLVGQKTPSGRVAFEFTAALASEKDDGPVCGPHDAIEFKLKLNEPLSVAEFTVQLELVHGGSQCAVVITVRNTNY